MKLVIVPPDSVAYYGPIVLGGHYGHWARVVYEAEALKWLQEFPDDIIMLVEDE